MFRHGGLAKVKASDQDIHRAFAEAKLVENESSMWFRDGFDRVHTLSMPHGVYNCQGIYKFLAQITAGRRSGQQVVAASKVQADPSHQVNVRVSQQLRPISGN